MKPKTKIKKLPLLFGYRALIGRAVFQKEKLGIIQIRFLTLIVYALTFTNSCLWTKTSASDGFKKYQNLVRVIDKAEGRAVIYLSSGYFTYSSNRKSFLINTDPENAETKKVEVAFKYANGSVTSLKIRFRPAIHIAHVSNNCASLRVDSLTFDQDGDRIPDQCGFQWDNLNCTSPNTEQLLSILNPSGDFSEMFTGLLFKNATKFVTSDRFGHPVTQRPFVNRVLFNDPTNAGLMVTFKQGKEWTISEKQTEGSSNTVTFNAASFANFKRIDYNLIEKSLDVRLDNAKFNLQNGHFESGKIALNIENNTNLEIANILFSQQGKDYEFQYSGANLNGNVSAGSSLTISNKTASLLLFDNGSYVGLQGVNFNLTNNTLDFSFEAGSKFNIKLLSGNLPLGDNGSISLDRSVFELDLAARYSKGNSFSTIGSIISTDINIGGGKVYFNGNQEPMLIDRGKIRAKNIIINSQVFPYLTGAFDFVQLACSDKSELSIKNSLSFSLNQGSVITFSDHNFPFTLLANEKFPIGKFYADIKFENFKNHKLGSLMIGTGEAIGNFRLIQEEHCLVDGLSLHGSFSLNFDIQNTRVKGDGLFFLRDGSLQYIEGQPRIDAMVSFQILKNQDYFPIEIQGNYDAENHRYIEKDRTTQYPVNIKLKLANNIDIPETRIVFVQNLISIDPIKFPVTANLVVPSGNGEREWPDGHFNGDSGEGKQEVARFDCPDPLGVMHFYVDPANETNPYSVNAQVLISSNQQQDIAITMNDLSLDRQLAYETVGCTGLASTIFGVVAGGIGSIICGPCSLPVAVMAYIKAGNLVNGIIQGKIYSLIQDFNHTVIIKAR